MKNRDFLEQLRQALGGTATQYAAELALDAVSRAMKQGLLEDGELRLARFGSFRIKERQPRRLKEPRRGEEMLLPARRAVSFHAASTQVWESKDAQK